MRLAIFEGFRIIKCPCYVSNNKIWGDKSYPTYMDPQNKLICRENFAPGWDISIGTSIDPI